MSALVCDCLLRSVSRVDVWWLPDVCIEISRVELIFLCLGLDWFACVVFEIGDIYVRSNAHTE